MKKIIFSPLILAVVIFLSSCGAGFVSIEPGYAEYNRPMRPSLNHIWIEGDWIWSGQSRQYQHRQGRWEQQRPGRSFEQGHWRRSGRGSSWIRGRWR